MWRILDLVFGLKDDEIRRLNAELRELSLAGDKIKVRLTSCTKFPGVITFLRLAHAPLEKFEKRYQFQASLLRTSGIRNEGERKNVFM